MFVETIKGIKVNTWTDGDLLKGYDFSMMNSINTCPMYGITRYVHNKVFTINEREMALECGELCHNCFAIYRACSIYYRGIKENNENLKSIGIKHIARFIQEVLMDVDEAKAVEFCHELIEKAEEKTTPVAKYTIFSDFLIDNSGYYDDPDDKKRTIENIKSSLLAYLSNFLDLIIDEPVWIADETDINTKVGIEIPFDIRVDIEFEANGALNVQVIHFIGKLDGIHVRKDGSLIIHENKTASRLDDSWVGQWYNSHQITGYCLAGSYFTEQNCMQARVLGMQIPVPKYNGYAFRTERVDRETHYFEDWARWVLTVHQVIEEYKDHPEIAPKNTHACCKYYKQCAFTYLCVNSAEERKRIINEEMIEHEWSPLDE